MRYSEKALNRMSSYAKEEYIKLLWYTDNIKPFWFWQRWFRTKDYKTKIENLRQCLERVKIKLDFIFTGEDKELLQNYYHYSLQVYKKQGGK